MKLMEITWVLYAICAAISFGAMLLVYKKLLLLGINPLILNLFVFGITFFGFVLITGVTKTKIDVNASILLLLVLASFFAVVGNFCDVQATKNAPNPGYASAIKSTQIIIITLMAPLLFKSSLTWPKLTGVILVLIGMIIISVF
jgi:uncharacterized membrane protein